MSAPAPYPGLVSPCTPGVPIVLGPYRFFVPPMSLQDMHQCVTEGLLETILGFQVKEGDSIEPARLQSYIDALVTVLERSIKRNYPTIERAVIARNIDVVSAGKVMSQVLNANAVTQESPPWAEPAPTPPPTPTTPEAV